MEMHITLLVLGGLLLIGLVADQIGRKTRLPRVTLLILFGLAVGHSGFDILPPAFEAWYEFLATVALTMVAFLLGGRLSASGLKAHGKEILVTSLSVVIATTVIVGVGLSALGVSPVLALLLAGIATATAPAAIQDVVHQTDAKGPFADILQGIVAIDDVWGLIVFSLLLVAADALMGNGSAALFAGGIRDIGGAFLVGAAVGLPAAYLTGRISEGEPMQAEAIGVVFVTAGLASWLEVSFLLAGITAGAIIVNLARHHARPFHEIEHIEWPFMVLFFLLAGASLDIDSLNGIGLVGAVYILLRVVSRVFGAWFGGWLAGANRSHQRWMGLALAPQAGVALGMALIAASRFPALAEQLLALTIGTTIIFELLGPILTQVALNQVSDTKRKSE